MSLYARVVAGQVVGDPIFLPNGLTPTQCFHADVADEYIACGSDVKDGWGYDGNAFAAYVAPPLTADQLATLKAGLSTAVDDAAEALRLTLITPGSGQAMEYQETYAEAVQVDAAVKAGQAVNASTFPMLSASVGLDIDPQTKRPTVDLAGEARAVLVAYDAYQSVGAAIRGARLRGKAAIDSATDEAAARAALAAIAWPQLG